MIQHIVVLKWKAATTAEQVERVFAQAEPLVDEIDGVERVTLGRNPGEDNHGFTHAFIVNLTDEDALTRYLDHPVRRRYLTEVLAPVEEARIEIDVPADDGHRHVARAEPSWKWGPTRHSAMADAAALRWEEEHDDPA